MTFYLQHYIPATTAQILEAFRYMKHQKVLLILWFVLLTKADNSTTYHMGGKIRCLAGSNIDLICTFTEYSQYLSFGIKDKKQETFKKFTEYSQYLSFGIKDKKQEAFKPIDSEYYKIINDTSVMLQWKNIPRMDAHIQCVFNRTLGVTHADMIADTPPIEAVDFKCRSYDFQYLTCSFIEIETYGLKLEFLPNICTITSNNSLHVCNISAAEYHPEKEHYNFAVKSENPYGTILQNFSINHLDNVIPSKPNISIDWIKPNRVKFKWSMDNLLYKKKGLIYAIKIRSNWTDRTENVNNLQNSHIIESLDAYTDYTLEIRSKVRTAEDHPEMWSSVSTIPFKTLPTAPTEPPAVNIGSYFIDSKNCIHIYWKILPTRMQNGPNFHYEIFEIKKNGKKMDIELQKTSSFSMMYCNMTRADYEFKIQSRNDNGPSSVGTVLWIPRDDYPKPRKVRSIITGTEYILFWSPPETTMKVTSYTVFHCILNKTGDSKPDGCHYNQSECQQFEFNQISANLSHYKLSLLTNHHENRFAVSANYANKSSGMVWTCCNGHEETELEKIEPFFPFHNSTAIKLKWILTCEQNSLVEAYRLMYCLVSEDSCVDARNITLLDTEVLISNLKPNSQYRFKISFNLTKRFSKTITQHTKEAAPSPPRNLKVNNVTTNSIDLKWNSPDQFNGQLKYYKLSCNNNITEIRDALILNKSKISYTITDLKSYHDYSISVIAVTILDSEPSNSLHIKTSVDYPDSITDATLEKVDTDFFLKWNTATRKRSSPIEIYEIKIANNVTDEIYGLALVNRKKLSLDRLDCSRIYRKYKISIRPINVAVENASLENLQYFEKIGDRFDKKLMEIPQFALNSSQLMDKKFLNLNQPVKFLYGHWSLPVEYPCLIAGYSSLLVILFLPAVGFLSLLLITIIRVRRKCNEMKNIHAFLPEGLFEDDKIDDVDNDYEDDCRSCEEISEEDGDEITVTVTNLFEEIMANNPNMNKEASEICCENGYEYDCKSCENVSEEDEDEMIVKVANMNMEAVKNSCENGYISLNRALEFANNTDCKSESIKCRTINGYIPLSDFEQMPLVTQKFENQSKDYANIKISPVNKPIIINGYVQHTVPQHKEYV